MEELIAYVSLIYAIGFIPIVIIGAYTLLTGRGFIGGLIPAPPPYQPWEGQ